MDLLLWIAGVASGLGFAAWGLARLALGHEALQREFRALAGADTAWRHSLANADEMIETLRRRVAELCESADALEATILEREKFLSPAERDKLPAHYILSDRMEDGRVGFRARIHSRAAEVEDRDYVVWARNRERAAQIFAARFRAREGFEVGPVSNWEERV